MSLLAMIFQLDSEFKMKEEMCKNFAFWSLKNEEDSSHPEYISSSSPQEVRLPIEELLWVESRCTSL